MRLLARLPREEDEAAWVAYAERVTALELSRAVRAVDRGSLEAGVVESETAKSRLFAVRCTPEVRWKWHEARAAARVAGRMLHFTEAAELIAAEVLSAVPIDPEAEEGSGEREGVSWSQETEAAEEGSRAERSVTGAVGGEGEEAAAGTPPRPPWRSERVGPGHDVAEPEHDAARPGHNMAGSGHDAPTPPEAGSASGDDVSAALASVGASLPPALQPLVERLQDADAFDLDARLRRALSLERRLEARIGPLLAEAWGRFVHRALGCATREPYARERLGMDPTQARALVRLERAVVQSEPFDRAYRTGALPSVKASVLEPLLSADPPGWFVGDWVEWAGRVTVRRLREDVEQALALSETDPEAFRHTGGLPPEARDDREIGAARIGRGKDLGEVHREIGVPPIGQEEDGGEAHREVGALPIGQKEDRDEAHREIGAQSREPEEHI